MLSKKGRHHPCGVEFCLRLKQTRSFFKISATCNIRSTQPLKMQMRPSHRALRFESLDSRLCFAFGDVDASFGGDGALDFSYQPVGKSFEFMRGLFEHQGHIRTLAIYGTKFGVSSVDSTEIYRAVLVKVAQSEFTIDSCNRHRIQRINCPTVRF